MGVYITKSPDRPGHFRVVLGTNLKAEENYQGGNTYGNDWHTVALGAETIRRAARRGFITRQEAEAAIQRLPAVLAELTACN